MSRFLSLVAATVFVMAANAFAQHPPGTPAPANVPNAEKLDKDANAKDKAKEKEARKDRRAQRKNIQHRQRRHS